MRTITPRILKTLQVLPNRMCTRIFIFRFENGPGNQSFFLSTTKIQLKRVNHNLSWWTIDAPWTGRVREASSGPWKNLIQHGFVEKKKRQANFVNRRKLLLKGYKFKESKCDRFGNRPAATAAEKIDEWSTEADVSAFCRSIGLFFVFCFFFNDCLRTLDLRFLLWMYLAKLLLERFWSAQQKAMTFFAAH